jgi:hypothetical protein
LEAFNIIGNKQAQDKKDLLKYQLLSDKDEQEKYLGEIYTYVPLFMNYLWENPKIISFLLNNSKKDDVKKYLAPLIVNNFYENILSSNYIEDHLLYVIGLLLKNEIDNDLNNKKDCSNFLEDTPCGIVLEQLKVKQDIQTYFKTLIFKIVEQLEVESSSYEINFSVKSIQEEFNKSKEEIEAEYKKTGKKQKNITIDFFKKNNNDDYESKNETTDEQNKESNLFNTKYIPSFDKEEYTKLINNYEKNKIMSDFLLSQYNMCRENPNVFSNETFLKNLFDSSASKEIFISYQIDFTKTIKIIDKFLKALLKNLYLLPYSVKCICKMILLMIRKKWPDLNIVDQNAFIAKFFFHKLFSPIFENPGIGALINNFIISGVTQHNLKIISFIIKRLFSGKFFIDGTCDYTPFNWYFIDNIQLVYQFFDNVTQVTLPPFMEKLINNELPKSFEYNYFKENPDEGIFHRSICFSFKDLCVLLDNMKELKEKIFVSPEYQPFKKTFEKLVNKSGTQEIERIKKNVEYEMIKVYDPKKKKEQKEIRGNPILKFFLITDILTNQKYTKIFNINQEKASFTLQEIPSDLDEDNRKNNVIKVKNFMCTLLNNYRTLVKTDFVEGTTYNTLSILKQLKNFMKISNFVIDGSIPSEWYVDSLLEYLNRIPTDLTNNDCDVLYKQIESHVNGSIKDIDFELLSVVLGNVKFCKRGQNYYEKMKTLLIDIELNEKVQNIVEKEPITVEIEFKYNNKSKELKIEKSYKKDIQLKSLDNMMFEEETQKTYYCRTIKAFTKRFPNIAKYQQIIEKDLTDMEKDLKLTQKISNYFNIIKEFLSSKNSSINNLIGSEEFNDISAKIYDYVMEKLYDKIFPREPDPSDNKIFSQCQLLSWTEPKHYIKSKTNLVFDSFLPDVINYFKEIDQQKSPRQKLIYMNKIFLSISNVVKFSGGGNTGVDDIMPILNYAFIKAKPPHMSSNCKYMGLFLGEKKNREEGSQLAQLTAICEFAETITADKLFNINSQQFAKRCMTAKKFLQ